MGEFFIILFFGCIFAMTVLLGLIVSVQRHNRDLLHFLAECAEENKKIASEFRSSMVESAESIRSATQSIERKVEEINDVMDKLYKNKNPGKE